MFKNVSVDGIFNESRRDVLKGGAALTLALCTPRMLAAATQSGAAIKSEMVPNAFVRIGQDGAVTVIAKHLEMGQGSHTGLATILAEELDADWSQVRVEGAPADTKLYANLVLGAQLTGGSSSIANSYEQLRTAGASARAMLVSAAAARWGVPASEIRVSNGVVSHAGANQRSARFGELVAEAAALPVPAKVQLKEPAQFTLIGKSTRRVDSRAKSTGTALFTQDVKLPGMLTAVVAHAPRFGGKVKSFDDTAARAIKGVEKVVAYSTNIRNGVAVLARDFWSAKKGRDALKIEWDDSGALNKSSPQLWAEYRALAATPGTVARATGNVDDALQGAAKIVEAEYQFPYLAHAAMEPMNCVVRLVPGGCEVWNGEQFQTGDQMALAHLLGLPPEQVKINMLFAGGSFGRRANPPADYLIETAAIAKAAGTAAPVKMVWTREEDMRAGFYRPMYLHAMKAGIDADGKLIAWQQRIVGQSIMEGTPFRGDAPVDPMSVEGAANLPYRIANFRVDAHTPKLPVPVLWWRSVGSTHTAFATECFLDEIARATKADPVELRRSLLTEHPRHRAVLDLAAQKAGWGTPLPKGKARGVAVHESFGSPVAQVVEVSLTEGGFKVDRVVCAVDCGVAINPNIIAMQVESSIVYGLSAAAAGAITLKDGGVEQSNFHDYPVLRINQMPRVEVHIVPSKEKPTGIGEPGLPPVAPAVANALAALTGKPLRALPFSQEGMQLA